MTLPRMGRIGRYAAIGVVVLGVGMVVTMSLFAWQRTVLYPGASSSAAAAAEDAARARQRGWQLWPQHAPVGLLTPPIIGGVQRGIAIVFHGNGGTAVDRTYYDAALRPLGWRVLLVEYPGYGIRAAEGPPDRSRLLKAAREAIEQAARLGEPRWVLGESLGSAVAAEAVAGSAVRPMMLTLITPFVSVVDLARQLLHLPVPESFVADRYDAAEALERYSGPVSVLIAGRDEVVGAASGEALVKGLPNARVVRLPHAGHNDWPHRMDAARWQQLGPSAPSS